MSSIVVASFAPIGEPHWVFQKLSSSYNGVVSGTSKYPRRSELNEW
jgi:hypothetical protein